ncbi:MAG: DUF721 domain-containing protein [Synergistaceae bacterium]|nr:DUF721 domain-containing protein [Synergistaceae bacterium]
MTTEDEKLSIDLQAWFPEAARRVEILDDMSRSWPTIVGLNVARYSTPTVFGVNGLTVEFWDNQAGRELSNMKGNVVRALKLRYNYETGDDFTLKVIDRRNKKG